MIGAGRPFRFMALLIMGWVAIRVVLLWPPAEAIAIAAQRATVVRVLAVSPTIALAHDPVSHARIALQPRRLRVAMPVVTRAAAVSKGSGSVTDARPVTAAGSAPAALALLQLSPTRLLAMTSEGSMAAATLNRPPRANRWSASSWMIARGGGGGSAALAPVGSLGGAQAGLRIAYSPALADGRTALFARAASPLAMRGADAAIGVQARPFARLPLHVAVEQRFALERGGSHGTALSMFGGISDTPVFGGLMLDAYAQGGVIGLRRRAAFFDGSATLLRPLTRLGDIDIALGAGAWGAAQPGATRLDVGPRLQLRVPVAGRRLRMGLEWRQRIAGRAAPGSGPALTMGADF